MEGKTGWRDESGSRKTRRDLERGRYCGLKRREMKRIWALTKGKGRANKKNGKGWDGCDG